LDFKIFWFESLSQKFKFLFLEKFELWVGVQNTFEILWIHSNSTTQKFEYVIPIQCLISAQIAAGPPPLVGATAQAISAGSTGHHSASRAGP
jgi:hypothetical protein